jgi:hypothetical protein
VGSERWHPLATVTAIVNSTASVARIAALDFG